MADYRYLFYDIASKRLIDVLPLEEVSFGWEFKGVGTISGRIPLYSDDLPAQRVADAVKPYRTKVFVERSGALIWGGWLNQVPAYDSTSASLTISGEEALGYFAVRTMPTTDFTGVDQLLIANAILETTQQQDGGDFWIHTDPAVTSGRLRDRHYAQFDQTPALTALTNLSEVIDGFDYAYQVGWVGDTPYEQLVLGYPRLGRPAGESGMVLEYNRFVGGGNVESYTWGDAGTPMATRSWANAETDEGVQLTASTEQTSAITAGYPLMEQNESFEGVVNYDTLKTHADEMAAYRAGPRVTATFRVKAQPGLEIGDFQLGDDVLVRITDWLFPPDPADGSPGYVGYMRLVGCSVNPGPEGTEEYQITCGDFIAAN